MVLFRSGFGLGIDADLFAGLAQTLELHVAVDLRVQGVVIADAHIGAGMDAGSALADKKDVYKRQPQNPFSRRPAGR